MLIFIYIINLIKEEGLNNIFLELKKKIKQKTPNKKGQGSLVALILGGIILSTVVSSATSWYLSMNQNMSGTNDRLEAMSVAMSEWQRLEHMSLDELEANRENYKTPYKVGDKFKVGVALGEKGFFDEGTCNSLTGKYSGESPNCFKDTIMTVYNKDNIAMYTTRSLPLSVSRDSFPEGTILPYTGDLAKIPHGWVLCDGTNGTPDLRGRFLEGTGTTTGEFKMAGLPDIQGRIAGPHMYDGCNILFHDSRMSGNAFYYTTTDRGLNVHTPRDSWEYYIGSDVVYFAASKHNSIYGNSTTVQPSSYTVFYIMKTNKDFHYEHTNGIVMPEYYNKEEVDKIIANTKKYFADNYNNKFEDINDRLDGNEFVKNYSPSYNLNLRYEKVDDEFKLHAYYDNTEIPLSQSEGTVIYPNGTAENPYVLKPYESLFVANPFPDYHIIAWEEVNVDGYWTQTGYTTAGSGEGTRTMLSQDENTIIVSAHDDVICYCGGYGFVNGKYLSSFANHRSAPIRIKVVKLSKK